MLTVKEINEVSFGKAGFSGYKPEDVDNFIDEVVASFQELQSERDEARKQSEDLAAKNASLAAKNAEAQEKLSILAQKIEAYREEEDGIKDAILSAQKLARDSVQEAKNKAEVIVRDAQDSARQILEGAKVEAAAAAKEYMEQAEAKRGELEEIKRQVTAFRSSLLEMYKKHLEAINHIPVFRQKEAAPEPAPVSDPVPEEPKAQPEEKPQPPVEPEPQPVPEPEPMPEPAPEPEPVPEPEEAPQPAPRPRSPRSAPTLHDRVDYTQEQMRERSEQLRVSQPLPEEDFLDDDLSEVGIDLKAYSDIPESLKLEKSSHFSNLEFGDNVDLGNRRKRKNKEGDRR